MKAAAEGRSLRLFVLVYHHVSEADIRERGRRNA